jgi:hypothetical protein
LHALKGVKHGAIEIITDVPDRAEPPAHGHEPRVKLATFPAKKSARKRRAVRSSE